MKHHYGDLADTRRRAVRAGMLKKGSTVRLSSAHGEIDRVVVFVRGTVVAVCTAEEFKRASRSGRRPTCVGFRLTDIISEGQEDSKCDS